MAKKEILIVEPDEHVRGFINDIFVAQGFSVKAAGSGEEGLEQLKKHKDTIGVIVTECIGLGEVGGIKLAMEARKLSPDVYISFHTTDPVVLKMLNGMDCTLVEKGGGSIKTLTDHVIEIVQQNDTGFRKRVALGIVPQDRLLTRPKEEGVKPLDTPPVPDVPGKAKELPPRS